MLSTALQQQPGPAATKAAPPTNRAESRVRSQQSCFPCHLPAGPAWSWFCLATGPVNDKTNGTESGLHIWNWGVHCGVYTARPVKRRHRQTHAKSRFLRLGLVTGRPAVCISNHWVWSGQLVAHTHTCIAPVLCRRTDPSGQVRDTVRREESGLFPSRRECAIAVCYATWL